MVCPFPRLRYVFLLGIQPGLPHGKTSFISEMHSYWNVPNELASNCGSGNAWTTLEISKLYGQPSRQPLVELCLGMDDGTDMGRTKLENERTPSLGANIHGSHPSVHWYAPPGFTPVATAK